MNRAALYARYSTEKQNEASIEDQFRAVERVATAAGLAVVGRFSDAGVSGGTSHRDGYQRLLAAARASEFDVIVVEDISRLWRSRAEWGARSAELEDLGVHLVTAVGDDTRRDGYGLILGIKQAIAENYRKEISYRTRRGLEGLALAGRSTGGRCFGYAPDGAGLVLSEAETVRRIFAARAAGAGLGSIASCLNADRVPAPRSPRWGKSTVAALLANPRYTGAVVWGATESKGGARDSRLKRRVMRSGGPLVERHDPALAIVPRELFDRVNGT